MRGSVRNGLRGSWVEEGSDATQDCGDLAEDRGVVTVDRLEGPVVRHQPDLPVLALEGLDGRFVVEHGRDDVAVVGRRLLFSQTFVSDGAHTFYDVSPDGKSFIFLKNSARQAQVVVVLNWSDELREKTPNR